KAVLEVGRDRQLGRGHERAGVGERLVAADRVVEAAERGREAAAGGGERVKAERREQPRGPHIPGVGEQQRLPLAVKRQKVGSHVVLVLARLYFASEWCFASERCGCLRLTAAQRAR